MSQTLRWTAEEQKQHRADWCAALESGDYQQAHMGLRDDRGFCCLGVACDVFFRKTGQGEWRRKRLAYVTPSNEIEGSVLPRVVRHYFGLRTEVGDYGTQSLTGLNDTEKWEFADIAEIIRSAPPGLIEGRATREAGVKVGV